MWGTRFNIEWKEVQMSDILNESGTSTLDLLFERELINLQRGAIFSTRPPTLTSVDRDRIDGMMLGLAIGDALGAGSESMEPAKRLAMFGEIRDYQPNNHAEGRRVGTPTDDSQMAFWTLEQLIKDGGYIPDKLAERFCQDRIFGIGGNIKQFIRNYKDKGLPWYEAGPMSAGNGSLMRIAPMVFPHFREPSEALWADTAMSSMTTHNDCAAISSCLAYVALLWDLFAIEAPPDKEWWSARYCQVLEDVDTGAIYRPRSGAYVNRHESFSRQIAYMVEDFTTRNLSTLDAGNAARSGAYLLETVPSVLYILQCYGDNPEEAIIRAVNDTWDNDTVAAIVGAAVGALHGKAELPSRWLDGLTGRTSYSDDGRMFEILEDAEREFVV